MPVRRIPRRSFLRGIGGVAVGLPALELMSSGGARAQEPPPRRFVVSFGGISTGADGTHTDLCTPLTEGPGYELRPALAPLETLGLAGEVSIVTGLVIPWMDGSEMPPAGRTAYYHDNTLGPQVAGTYAGHPDAEGEGQRDGAPKGPTCDQVVADAIGDGTRQPVLAYRVQPASYSSTDDGGTPGGRLSFRRDRQGILRGIDPIVSPRLAYESLFAGLSPEDPAGAAHARALLRRRTSVLDLVDGATARLLPRLGAGDRARMDRHFEEIRALERRLATASAALASCSGLAHPGEDPPIGSAIVDVEGSAEGYTVDAGYSDEELRADILSDLITVAFACDQSRAASYMLTECKCFMNMFAVSSNRWQTDMHGATHQGNQLAVTDAVAWHVDLWGRLVAKLRDTPDAEGTSLLDHTAMVLLFEGGFGYDPEGRASPSAHSTENMIALVAGRAGGLVPGIHVSAPGAHPASVVVTAMRAVGVDGGLGEIADDVPELLGGA